MSNEVIIGKLIAHVDKILGYCRDTDYAQFCADSKLVEACVFNLSQMGELSNRLDDEFVAAHPDIPWHALYGLRNRIVHDYEGVNLSLIWQVIQDDLLPLRGQLEKI